MLKPELIINKRTSRELVESLASRAEKQLAELNRALYVSDNARALDFKLHIIQSKGEILISFERLWDDKHGDIYEQIYPDILNCNNQCSLNPSRYEEDALFTEDELRIIKNFIPKINRLRRELRQLFEVMTALSGYLNTKKLAHVVVESWFNTPLSQYRSREVPK